MIKNALPGKPPNRQLSVNVRRYIITSSVEHLLRLEASPLHLWVNKEGPLGDVIEDPVSKSVVTRGARAGLGQGQLQIDEGAVVVDIVFSRVVPDLGQVAQVHMQSVRLAMAKLSQETALNHFAGLFGRRTLKVHFKKTSALPRPSSASERLLILAQAILAGSSSKVFTPTSCLTAMPAMPWSIGRSSRISARAPRRSSA
mmetsp:Transcript_77910/g.241496  ORF Transcript_77910/g.241496 Transcript_77910/m.241496 type:complete len:200 (-) Transcript_77910:227-826(-)